MHKYVCKSLKIKKNWIIEFFGRDHRWTFRRKFTRDLLVCEVPTRSQHKHVDTRGHVAMKSK